MVLNSKEIKSLINECKIMIEQAYQHQLEEDFGGDEYFKRGFLLACNELTKLFINKLSKFKITNDEGNNA